MPRSPAAHSSGATAAVMGQKICCMQKAARPHRNSDLLVAKSLRCAPPAFRRFEARRRHPPATEGEGFKAARHCDHPTGPGPPPSRGPYFAAFPPGITNSTTTLRSRG
jgi:hypothetical protein